MSVDGKWLVNLNCDLLVQENFMEKINMWEKKHYGPYKIF